VRALAATRRCGTCGGEHLTPIADAGDDALTRLRCPSCGQRALTLRAAGRA
jgi:DNA-directed RNA polymerase subunit RPC12/RpoP